MKKLFAIGLLVAMTTTSMAEDLKGVIMNVKQRPLKGMKIWRKNTTESVITDKMGNFAFTSIQPTDTLVIMVSKKEEAVIPVKDMTNIDVKIEKGFYLVHDGKKEDKREYKRVERSKMNSNTLTHEQILRLGASNFYDLFRGTIPGVNVNYGDNGQIISVRGNASLEQDIEPLFVVDGSQYEHSSDVESSISINDIQKIEVSKDGAGYGVKGANGVIIITTLKK